LPAAAAWLIGLALFFAFHAPAWGKYDPLPTGVVPGVWYVVVALLMLALLRAASRMRPFGRWGIRASVLLLTLLFTAMAWTRFALAREVEALTNPWPPRPERVGTIGIDARTPAQRAEWGARVGAHVAVDRGHLVMPLHIPPEWPFPKDVELAVRELSASAFEIWARASDGTTACQLVHLTATSAADGGEHPRCSGQADIASALHYAAPARTGDAIAVAPLGDELHPAWLQFRADPARSGQGDNTDLGPDSMAADGWHTALHGPIRASASVSGDLVLIGGHGTGSLTAMDVGSGAVRWIARTPNWIHHDPVTDGHTVVVGFGDNDGSFAGWAPSGVAAYDLETGARRWAAFDEGSVMTSPVIHDSVIIYGTGVGLLRQRRLRDGKLLVDERLPGSVTMAPPVAIGDTIVFGLDHGMACALDINTLDRLWCHEFPDLRMLGHAAPSITEGSVIVSGVATVTSPSWAEFRALPHDLQWRLLRSALFPGKYEVYAGQVFVALDLHDGHQRWRSPLFANPRLVDGHTAGTAAVQDGIGVIVLPIADTVVAFETATGAIRWTSGANKARGAPLVLDHDVVIAGRNGIVEVRHLTDGLPRCTLQRAIGWDRAGPALAGSLAIFAGLEGEIEAIPTRDLLHCPRPDGRPVPK
jgi:outer membrane protein assembly factor BamB